MREYLVTMTPQCQARLEAHCRALRFAMLLLPLLRSALIAYVGKKAVKADLTLTTAFRNAVAPALSEADTYRRAYGERVGPERYGDPQKYLTTQQSNHSIYLLVKGCALVAEDGKETHMCGYNEIVVRLCSFDKDGKITDVDGPTNPPYPLSEVVRSGNYADLERVVDRLVREFNDALAARDAAQRVAEEKWGEIRAFVETR